LLAAVGGFDERFRCAWREDTDLCFRLRASGAIVRKSNAARVVHPVRPARWGVSLAQQRKVMFDALLYKKFPRGYRRYIRPRPPWEYYAAVAAGLCGIVNAIAGQPVLAILSLLVWLGIGIAFARRRLSNTSHAPRHVAEMLVTSLLIPWLSVYWRTRGALHFRVPFV
jgi:cellulose synthase/poly-beta-1,6-N-acetylglucosamine synthase-like glycosyltransferase